MKDSQTVMKILDLLSASYPDAACELNFSNPFELLVATILSAQTTDKQVNIVTEKLFRRFPNPESFAKSNEQEVAEYIKALGLYRNKSKNLVAASQTLLDRFAGEVPKTMEELLQLPGVGRKTANVVLSNAFGIPAIAVDTHVFRVSNRIGLAKASNPNELEQQLMEEIPQAMWSLAHHLLIFHGRRTCQARKPKCEVCIINKLCDYIKEY